MKFYFSSMADLSLSPSFNMISSNPQARENLVVIVSPTHPLVDPRYTTSKVVKGRWCAEAVPPRTKRDSQYIAQQRHRKNSTSGEHEWLLSVQAQSRF